MKNNEKQERLTRKENQIIGVKAELDTLRKLWLQIPYKRPQYVRRATRLKQRLRSLNMKTDHAPPPEKRV